jgi:heat shock protein HslJ
MKKEVYILIVLAAALIALCAFLLFKNDNATAPAPEIPDSGAVDASMKDPIWEEGPATERYTARVDRVEVVFEHRDYTTYRLKTNDLVRTGELNTERGFKDDVDATVYVLNWQKPEGEQIRYVRLTSEPTKLYALDGNQEIIQGSKLVLDTGFEGEADPDRMTLDMTKWKWQKVLYNDGREIIPTKPDVFALTFNADKTFSASTDCNGVGGNYSVNQNLITFDNMVSTLMYCDGSQEAEFIALLQNTASFFFTSRGELILELKYDSGTVTFR